MLRVSMLRLGNIRHRIVLGPACVADKATADEYESSILFAVQIRRLFPFHGSPERSCGLRVRSAVLKLNRCARSLKLYVVADTHACYPLPRYIHAQREPRLERLRLQTRLKRGRKRRRRAPRRAFRIKMFVSTELPLAAISFITLSR